MAAKFPNIARKLALDILLHTGRNPKLRLFKDIAVDSALTVIGDLTQADFDGYAAIDLSAMTVAAINGDGKGFKELLANNFTRATTGTLQTIKGWYITIDNLSAAQQLFLYKLFSAPVVVEEAGHFVEFDLSVLDNIGT